MPSAPEPRTDHLTASRYRGVRPGSPVRTVVRATGLWLAVLLPFVVLALFVSGRAGAYPELVAGLLTLSLLGLAVGRQSGH